MDFDDFPNDGCDSNNDEGEGEECISKHSSSNNDEVNSNNFEADDYLMVDE